MDIKSSLAIEEKYNTTINLIFSGSFVKVYNRSFYLLTEVLGKSLKPSVKYPKSAGYRLVVSGGFPFHTVEKDFPQAQRREWGYQISGDFDADAYTDWLLWHEMAAEAAVNVVTAAGSACPQSCVQAEPAPLENTVYKHSINLPINPQQATYLSNWQRGTYPIDALEDFVESLQQQLTKIEPNKD